VHLAVGGEGFDFLGFHHRLVRARGRTGARRITFLARWPSRQAMQHARDRIRELTARERLLLPVEDVVQDINAFLRGWAGYFRHGNSAPLRQDRHLRARAAVALRSEAPSQAERLRLADGRLRVAEPDGPDQPQRTRRCATTEPAVAGEAECRR